MTLQDDKVLMPDHHLCGGKGVPNPGDYGCGAKARYRFHDNGLDGYIQQYYCGTHLAGGIRHSVQGDQDVALQIVWYDEDGYPRR